MVGSIARRGLLPVSGAARHERPAGRDGGRERSEPLIVTLLGTEIRSPATTRNGPAILVQAGGLEPMFDASRRNRSVLRQAGLWRGRLMRFRHAFPFRPFEQAGGDP